MNEDLVCDVDEGTRECVWCDTHRARIVAGTTCAAWDD